MSKCLDDIQTYTISKICNPTNSMHEEMQELALIVLHELSKKEARNNTDTN